MASAVSVAKKTEKKKRLKAVQQKKRLFRSNDSVISVLMWGINHSITEMAHVKIPVMLMPDEFKAFTKIRIDNHMFNKDNMPSHFQFKECCPLVFRNLRERFSIDETRYLNSLTKHSPVNMSSPGRSGSRFLMSYDKQFIIKTMNGDEVNKMNRILKDYHQYIVECHAKTLLPQYYGMYRIRINESDPTFFIVMRNIFSPRFTIHKRYDLKGSSVDRSASEKERAKEHPTFKDNDFINDKGSIEISSDDREKFIKTLEADVTFLASLNLMDYSLLVGIHDSHQADVGDTSDDPFDSEDNVADDDDDYNAPDEFNGVAGMGSTPPDSPLPTANQPPRVLEIDCNADLYAIRSSSQSFNEIYFMALIDVLTDFGVNKRTAQIAKTMKHGAGAEISTVKPDQYARRFMEFINRIIK